MSILIDQLTFSDPELGTLKYRNKHMAKIDFQLDYKKFAYGTSVRYASFMENVDDVLPEYLTRTAHKIDSVKRVNVQGVIQRYIDHSISSTINLPEDVNPETISDTIFLHAKNILNKYL